MVARISRVVVLPQPPWAVAGGVKMVESDGIKFPSFGGKKTDVGMSVGFVFQSRDRSRLRIRNAVLGAVASAFDHDGLGVVEDSIQDC